MHQDWAASTFFGHDSSQSAGQGLTPPTALRKRALRYQKAGRRGNMVAPLKANWPPAKRRKPSALLAFNVEGAGEMFV
jgi:hypothetical protein